MPGVSWWTRGTCYLLPIINRDHSKEDAYYIFVVEIMNDEMTWELTL